ncbi:MAG TPA: PDZ domain-containing protein [Blastocatellia bacterium]|nr:PDZ domain-containing protein [Blastocatellia bacterium]
MIKTLRLLETLVLACLIGSGAPVQTWAQSGVSGGAGPSDHRAAVYRESFDIVWNTVKEKHFDPKFGGVDWDQVRLQYLPRLNEVKSDAELYKLLERMLSELHESHFAILPPAVQEEDSGGPNGSIGVDLRFIGDQIVITKVASGSTAARAGLRPGFVITRVDGAPIEQILQPLENTSESVPVKRLREVRVVAARLDGRPSSVVRVEYLDEHDRPRLV